ncbi:MOB kinase activator 2-like isoform X2 [Babylonia areolata]|uniref:MOB kinase activator 2-like isoform X2 n=1 Tax=Babylonia areolata TaxID=304850 RepID=UPI003FD3B498
MTTGVLFVMNFWKGRRKDKDSPTPPINDEQKQYLEEECLRQRVIDADFVKLVQLPPSLDSNEWLATHTISFFNHVNLMYGVVSEYCTSDSCSSMVGPDNVQYHWQDEKGKKVKQSAPQYIDHMMSYIQKSVTDESLFPTKFGQEFPAGFPDTIRKIHRYLFHVLAHMYHSHYALMVTLGMHGHLNTLFSHFMVFSVHFQLLVDKEAEVLMDLHKGLLKAMQDPNQNTDSSAAKDGSPEQPGDTPPPTEAGDHTTSLGGGPASPSSPSQTVCSADAKTGSLPPQAQTGSVESAGKGCGSRSGSENGAAATGTGVHGKKTVVDIPSS